MKHSMLALAATFALTAALPAHAQDSRVVSHRDLDLGSTEGQAVLDQRIKQAARSICGLDGTRTGAQIAAQKELTCYRAAQASADRQRAAAIAAQQFGG